MAPAACCLSCFRVMDIPPQQIPLILLAVCGPFVLLILIAAILSPRFGVLAERNGWTIEPHPADRRDFLFRGSQGTVSWEMEYYVYDHYRQFPPGHTPFVHVIVWRTSSRTLPQNTVLVYRRGDRLKHFQHPRLIAGQKRDARADLAEDVLSALPEKAVGIDDFRESFVVRSDLETLPQDLVHALQYALSSWSNIHFVGPVILIDRSGLTLWWLPMGRRDEWLERTVRLGTSLAGKL